MTWIVIGSLAWVVLAVASGIVVGKAIKLADAHEPSGDRPERRPRLELVR